MATQLTKKQFFDLGRKEQLALLAGLDISVAKGDKESALYDKYTEHFKVPTAISSIEKASQTTPTVQVDAGNKQITYDCPTCGAKMANIKNFDYVCENKHGWSGYPPAGV